MSEIIVWDICYSLIYIFSLVALIYVYTTRPPQNYYTRVALKELMVAIVLAITLEVLYKNELTVYRFETPYYIVVKV